MGQSRKILCTLVLATFGLGGLSAMGEIEDSSGQVRLGSDLVEADLSQAGRALVAKIRTRTELPLARLARQPAIRRRGVRFLCLSFRRVGGRGERWLCLGGARNAHRRVGLLLVNAAGRVVGKRTLRARVRRPGPRMTVLAIRPDRAGLRPGRYRWRVLENGRGCRRCRESVPARGTDAFRLRPVRPIGCTGGSAGLVTNGPRDRKLVALTFDDGPSSYTDDFLAVLRNKHADATFAMLGQELPGYEDVVRQVLRDGNEIANHSTHHGYPGHRDLVATNALIRAATHFQPCLFRPPGGVVNSAIVETAGRAGMKTVLWDVDPADWSNPGSGAIYSRVVGAVRPGSIVVMHDGGGSRDGTLAALPSIIDTLRARGYGFATVSALIGERMIYRPYG